MKRVFSKLTVIVLCVSLCFAIAACGGGPSEEKVNKVQTDYAALVTEHNEVVQVYSNAVAAGVQLNQEAVDSFNEAADYVNEFGEYTLNDKTDDDLDEYIRDIADYRSSLRTLKSQLESLIAENEQQANQFEPDDDYDDEEGYDDEEDYYEEE